MIQINNQLEMRLFPTQRQRIEKFIIFNNGKALIQGPVLDKIRSHLDEEIELSDAAKSLYKKIRTVKLEYRNGKYRFTFNKYPRRPWILQNKHNYFRFIAIVEPASKNAKRKFVTPYRFLAYAASEWLEKEGYIVRKSRNINFNLDASGQEKIEFGELSVSPREHQEDNLVKADQRDYRIVIGDAPGLGKTISAGLILYKLYVEGKVNRIIWVVPNTQLTEQIKGEMEDKFNTDVLVVTGETFSRDERLGLEERHGRKVQVDRTAYEKSGFICTNWSLFSKDFAKDKKYTEHIQFDAVVFDEVHRCKEGNLSYTAAAEILAPYRISLSGTVMPNGKYEELFDALNITDPPAAPAKDYFKNIYYKKKESEEEKCIFESKAKKRAREQVNKIALKYMIPKIAYHTKVDVVSGLPDIAESKIHIQFSDIDKTVFDIYREMLSQLIDRIKDYPDYGDMNDDLASEKGTVNAAMLMVWRDLQRFCSFGSNAISYRIDEYQENTEKAVYAVLRDMFPRHIRELSKTVGKATKTPKNKKIIEFIRKNTDANKFVVFCTEIAPNKELVFDLVKKGVDAKVIMGGSNRLTDEEAELLDQPYRFRTQDVQAVLDWFWMPWSAISDFLISERSDENLDKVMVDGSELKNFFYTALAVKLPRDNTPISIYLNNSRESVINDFIDTINDDGFYRAVYDETEIKIILTYDTPPTKALVTTDKLQEGVNLQDARCMIFYDYPFSIRSREQRMSRVWRDGSYHDIISVIYVMNGIEYKIEKRLQEKYDSSGELGSSDPSPISMGELFRMM